MLSGWSTNKEKDEAVAARKSRIKEQRQDADKNKEQHRGASSQSVAAPGYNELNDATKQEAVAGSSSNSSQ